MPERPYLTGTVEMSERPTIPAGTYTATLEGIEERDSKYGTRWLWRWLIPDVHPDGGDFEIMAWTAPRFASTGLAREMATALGQPVGKGIRTDLSAMRGRRARLLVKSELDKDNEPRNAIVSVSPVAAPQPAPGASGQQAPAPVASSTQDPDYQAWLAERQRHATDGRPASVDEREALDAGTPLPEPPSVPFP